jgi:hypothetical protein
MAKLQSDLAGAATPTETLQQQYLTNRSIERRDGADRRSQVLARRQLSVALRMEWPSMLRKMCFAKMSFARNTPAPAMLAIALCLSACAGPDHALP